MKTLGVMVDCSRNAVLKPDSIKQFVDLIAQMGYNMLQLYTEDTYAMDNQPYFGYMRGRYTQDELQDLDRYCSSRGVELVPCIQVLAHLNQISEWDVYKKTFDCFDILLVGEESTYALIDDMFRTLRQCFRSKRVNIGMDEAHFIGLGEYLNKHGFEERSHILVRHLQRVQEIAKKYDFSLMMWSDMFIRLLSGGNYYATDVEIPEQLKQQVPKDIGLIYWDYYSENPQTYAQLLSLHKKLSDHILFAGGGWTWSGFSPNLRFAEKVTDAAADGMQGLGIDEAILTLWGDDGGECPAFASLPALFYFAQRMNGIPKEQMDFASFANITGYSYEDFSLLDAPNLYGMREARSDASAKIFLYNDPLLGLFDLHVPADAAAAYAAAENSLRKVAEKEGGFSLLFETSALLCRVLKQKCDLGIRTREAYRQNDTEALCQLAEEYLQISEDVEAFYVSYRAQWHAHHKSFGFEVQDIRLGGLVQRLRHCAQRLLDYAQHKTDAIEELEQSVLPYHESWSRHYQYEYRHRKLVTASVF